MDELSKEYKINQTTRMKELINKSIKELIYEFLIKKYIKEFIGERNE